MTHTGMIALPPPSVCIQALWPSVRIEASVASRAPSATPRAQPGILVINMHTRFNNLKEEVCCTPLDSEAERLVVARL